MTKYAPFLLLSMGLAVSARASDAGPELSAAGAQIRGLITAKTAGTPAVSFSAVRSDSGSTGRMVLASNAGPIQCSCARWGQITSWTTQVCTHYTCYPGDHGGQKCECDEHGTVAYDMSSCEQWKQNFCNQWAAASANTTPLASLLKNVGLNCPSGREVSYDATVQACGTMYRYANGEWTTHNPLGGSSCSTRTIRLSECAD
jgi:hypothetical protein